MSTNDLGIENGTVVMPTGRSRLNVYIRDGRITSLTPERESTAVRIDASDLLVMPGMVDTHVHLMDPGATEREDFPSGTAAAALAGVTTIVEHTHAAPVREPVALHAKVAHLASRSRVDFGLAGHAWPDRVDQVPPLWRAGATFLKVFTCTTHGIPMFDNAASLDLFRIVADVGAVCLVHSEDEAITRAAEHRLRAAGREDPGIILEWRNREAELRKFTPPARARTEAELDDMWRRLRDGTVDLVSTDHAPATQEQKQRGSIWDAPFGLPGLDITLPLLLDAAAAGRISYERVVAAYSEIPARTYGLFPRKGQLAIGADADLVLVDPVHRWTLEDDLVRSKARWTPYAGRSVAGRPVATILRGKVIAQKGEVLAEPGTGQWIPGPGAAGR